jgi:hypothetical protein
MGWPCYYNPSVRSNNATKEQKREGSRSSRGPRNHPDRPSAKGPSSLASRYLPVATTEVY